MSNIFEEIGEALKDGAADIAKGEAWIGHIAKDIETAFEAEVKLAPETAAALSLVVGDVENLAILSAGAVSSEGLNFAADSLAYVAFQKLMSDLKHLGGQIKTDVAALKP